MLYKDIKIKSIVELNDLIIELRAELFLLRFKNKTGQHEQTHKIAIVRKDIAKVLTALKEKELHGDVEQVVKPTKAKKLLLLKKAQKDVKEASIEPKKEGK